MKKVNNVKMFAEKTDFFKREICLFCRIVIVDGCRIVTVHSVHSNVGFFYNKGKEFLTLRKIIVCYILIFWQY